MADDLREALTSARRIMVGDPRDWTADRHDAFLYGLFRGWDDPQASATMADVAALHGWDEAFVARLRRLCAAVDSVIDGNRMPTGALIPERVDPRAREGTG